MKKIDFNQNWTCYRSTERETAFAVSLPHDAMLLDPKSSDSVSGVNLGWIDAQDYTYEKELFAPQEWKEREVFLHFEGAMRKATVYINGEKAAFHEYGYTAFDVPMNAFLRYGEPNIIRVECVNHDQPNSRWYSGTGLYRPVYVHVYPKEHILPRGIKIHTVDLATNTVAVNVKTTGKGSLKIDFLGYKEETVLASYDVPTEGNVEAKLAVPGAQHWSMENPVLYRCRVTFTSDSCAAVQTGTDKAQDCADIQTETFGIRTIECTPAHGFCLNGEHVILRGACIHHDNGILGAAAFADAEYRKVKLMKENGYNAIRSAHNPCSEAMLRACDELGVLLMNEYVDVWYIHKTKFDYAGKVETNYKEDLKELVDESYNHPSVILYSTGNEVAETAQKKGIALTQAMTDYLHELDSTRPVTCGINIFFNFLSSMGFGVYSDKKADAEINKTGKKKAVGSEFFNNLAGLLGADFMKFGAALYPCDVKTRDAFAAMDVAGYNYGINRYENDLKKYPERLILGSETFCSDAYRFYELAKKQERLIGDFVWAGMDYLGEAGIGSWEYKAYAPEFDHGIGWVAAGSGRVDLTGKPLAEAAYTQVAFGLKDIAIGVVPVMYAGEKHSPSAWKMSNALESWSFRGCDGMKTQVEVYARGHYVKLYVNRKCVGKKMLKDDCKAVFRTTYHDGSVTAVAYDESDKEIARTTLKTAEAETKLTLTAEEYGDLIYVRAAYTDKNGVVKPMERGDVTWSAQGGEVIGSGSGCPYYTKPYTGAVSDTYYGETLAVIRKDKTAAKTLIHAKSKAGSDQIVL